MYKTLYSTGIYFLGIGMKLASIFHPKAKLWVNGRKNIFQTLEKQFSKTDQIIWMHASSLGEYEQGVPVLEALKKQYPNYKFAISFYSPSGYEIIKNKNKEDFIFYLPLDTKSNAENLIRILNPKLAIFVKYDFWYNTLLELEKENIETIFISAIFRENQIYFKPNGKWFVSVLQNVSHFFVQNEKSKKLLESIQINRVTVSGDTRFDRVKMILQTDNHLEWLENFKQDKMLLTAGSTWEEDDDMLVEFINSKLSEDIRVVIAPHNMNPKYFEKLRLLINVPTLLYSQRENKNINDFQVIIVDTVGMLTKIYSYTDIAYVGGAFGKEGVHNVLEPAVFGIPVLYGPIFHKFIEAEELLEKGGAEIIQNKKEFTQTLSDLIHNSNKIKTMGENAQKYVLNKPNSTEIILKYIKENL